MSSLAASRSDTRWTVEDPREPLLHFNIFEYYLTLLVGRTTLSKTVVN